MIPSFRLRAEAEGKERSMEHPTAYRTRKIDGLSIFYRETGPKGAPPLLLLHGLPSSSRMFEPLFGRLSDRCRLVAPLSGVRAQRLAGSEDVRVHLRSLRRDPESLHRSARALALHALHAGLRRGPVGFRMALAHPDRIEALIVQDAVAHNEGLGANWKTRRAFWADRAANESALRANLLSLQTTRTRLRRIPPRLLEAHLAACFAEVELR